VKRFGWVAKARPEKLAEYRRLHADVWPDVLEMIRQCNLRNYSIYYRGGYLFSYAEYVGEDFEADMARMAADEATREWWAICVPCLEPVDPEAAAVNVWAEMEEIFHLD
jgi:L-rhamnose mutarotase